MRIREAAMFAAYASVIVYGLSAMPALVTASPSAPTNVDAILMVPLTYTAVFIASVLYLRRHQMIRASHGAELGALSAFFIYCAMVISLMSVFYSSVEHWYSQGLTSQTPGAIGLYGIVFSPVLLPAALMIGALAGMMYVHVKRLLGLATPVMEGPPTRRRRRIGMALAMTAMVVIAVPAMIFLGGLPALMLLSSLLRQ